MNYPVVLLDITEKCDKKCKHCLKEKNDLATTTLTIKDYINIINEFDNLNVKKVKITGGEPALSETFDDIVTLLDEKNINFDVFTNGDAILSKLYVLNSIKSLDSIRFGIEGMKNVHDCIREPGNFDNTVSTMLRLQNSGLSCTANITINKMNYTQILEMVDYFSRLSIDVTFSIIKFAGRAMKHPELTFSKNEVGLLLNQMRHIKLERPDVFSVITESLCDPREFVKEKNGKLRCLAGQYSFVIDSFGYIWPCSLLKGNDIFCAGNIREEPLVNCIFKLHEVWNSLDTMNDKCMDCVYYEKCSGGCRGNAINISGDMNASDPNCVFYSNTLYKLI